MAYQPSIMSASLGRAWIHALPHKINQASLAGIKGFEIFYEDLEHFARDLAGKYYPEDEPTPEHLLNAASEIKSLCDKAGLEIIDLQPFFFYDGLKDRDQHGRLIEKLAVVRSWARETTSCKFGHSVPWNIHGSESNFAMWLCIPGAMECVTPMPTRWNFF